MRLRWKLTLSYTLVTAGAILLIELVVLVGALVLLTRADTVVSIVGPVLYDATTDLAPAVTRQPPDEAALRTWLAALVETGQVLTGPDQRRALDINLDPASVEWALFADPQGRVLAAYPDEPCRAGASVSACVAPPGVALVETVLQAGAARYQATNTDDGLFLAVAVPDANGRRAAVLLLRVVWPTTWRQWPRTLLDTLLPSAAVVLVFAALLGTVFGFFTARGLTRRLTALAQAADAWSRGDFRVLVRDLGRDELGQLARRLNRMAEQLHALLQTRQELAALEERNRLARELHDAVKQQVFAAGMQVAAARRHLPHNADRAAEALQQAEGLLQQAQQELTGLIRQLRPAALHDQGLAAALQAYLRAWQQQTGIHADLHLQGQRPLPLEVEQALLRVTQEALANVARHSQARQVVVRLTWQPHAVTLEVRDDGRGFDPARARGRGLGLHSMTERMQALGGSLQVDSAPGQGTRIVAQVPLSNASP